MTTDGNDSTGTRGRKDLPFRTVRAAVAAEGITAGDVIVVGPGTFTETVTGVGGADYDGLPIVVPNGVDLEGAGKGVTTITNVVYGPGTKTDIEVAFQPGSGSEWRDLSLVCAPGGTSVYSFTLGVNMVADAEHVPTDVTLRRASVMGASDALYFKGVHPAPQLRWRAIGCDFVSQYDSVALLAPTSITWDAAIDLWSCEYTVAATTWQHQWRAVTASNVAGSLIRVFGGSATVHGNNATSVSAAVGNMAARTASTIRVYGTRLFSSANSGTYIYDLYANGTGALLQVFPGTVAVSTSATSGGTITNGWMETAFRAVVAAAATH